MSRMNSLNTCPKWYGWFRKPNGIRQYLRLNAVLTDEDYKEYPLRGKSYDHDFLLNRDAYGDWVVQAQTERSWKRHHKKRKQFRQKHVNPPFR